MEHRFEWEDVGFPDQIVTWLTAMEKLPKGKRHTEKAARFASFWRASPENAEKLTKTWRALEKAAKKDPSDALTAIMMLLPDKPERQPFSLLYGKRAIDPGEEKERYDKLLGHVSEIQKHLNPHNRMFENMLHDSTATPAAHIACLKFREVENGLFVGLRALRELLEKIEPRDKIPTKHWKADDADVKNYVILVAALNRYLEKPQHAALAFLANVNYPSVSITADQVRKAWANGADKRA